MADPKVIYKEKLGNHSWCRWMVARTMRKNQNNLIMIKGKTGTGKTFTALSICEIMNKIDGVEFNIDHVVFGLKELLELVNSGKLKRGSKIIFDEPQISISARDFQSKANKIFNSLVSTFRHKNFSLFFCAPFEGLLDKNTRKLFHAIFETRSLNLENNTCRVIPRSIEYSEYKENKVYRKRLIIELRKKNGDTETDFLDYWDVPKPSQELIDLYEKKKTDFTTKLNKKLYDDLLNFEKDPIRLTNSQKRTIDLMIKHSGDKEKVAEEEGVNVTSIYTRIKGIENKGYNWEDFK
ncbi:MAG: hypothetical protein PHS54_01370 [Clostridia bacterium]|nr:hypothetical protein [Clostridia bacterium]